MADATVLQKLLFLGEIKPFEWDDLGVKVVYDSFSSGAESELIQRVSGLDPLAKDVALKHLRIAAALRSVDGFDFGNESSEREKFIRGLQPPVLEVFWIKFIELRAKQSEIVDKYVDEIKKARMIPSSEPSGSSSS